MRFLIFPNWIQEIKFGGDSVNSPVRSITLDTAMMTIEATLYFTTQNQHLDKVINLFNFGDR